MFASITVLAPGLLGGSVAKAVRARGLAERIHLWSRREETRASLRKQPWCDKVHDTPESAVTGSGLVVVCAPVDHIASLVARVAPALSADALVTDVGSVKGTICHNAAAAVHGHGVFVGSHPMAGSDRTGHAHADADLFRGRVCFVTPMPDTPPDAAGRIGAFWKALEARVVVDSPENHDRIVAHLSHLPHALASALCSLLAGQEPCWRELAGPGLRDTTRIAASDSDLWRSIFQLNRLEILAAIDAFQGELQTLRDRIACEDWEAVRATLEQGRVYREHLRA